jgi:hypothetical protein
MPEVFNFKGSTPTGTTLVQGWHIQFVYESVLRRDVPMAIQMLENYFKIKGFINNGELKDFIPLDI